MSIASNTLPHWRMALNSVTAESRARTGPAGTLARLFGLDGPAPTTEALYRDFELTLRPGQITAVIGPSGCGKSMLLRLVAAEVGDAISLDVPRLRRTSRPAVACVAGTLSRRLALLSSCGLAEATVLIRPAKLLSDGQLHRLALAVALDRAARAGRPMVVIADEFAACLDSTTAGCLCAQVRRAVSQSKVSLLVATTRPELLASLRPDQVIVKPLEGKTTVISEFGLRISDCGSATSEFSHASRARCVRTKGKSGISGFERLRSEECSTEPSCIAASLSSSATSCNPLNPPNPEIPPSCSGPDKRSGRSAPGADVGPAQSEIRNPNSEIPSPIPDARIETGSIRDYSVLSRFHYISGQPAAHKRVYVIRPPKTGQIGDLLLPEVAAVLVVSPPLRCVRGRNIAMPGRYVSAAGRPAGHEAAQRGGGVDFSRGRPPDVSGLRAGVGAGSPRDRACPAPVHRVAGGDGPRASVFRVCRDEGIPAKGRARTTASGRTGRHRAATHRTGLRVLRGTEAGSRK